MRAPPWLWPAVAAVALALGVLVLDWVVIDVDTGLTVRVGPRSVELCASAGCVDGRHAGKPFAALPTAVFVLGLGTALGLLGVAVARFTHTELGPLAAAPAGWPSSWGGNVVDYGMDPAVVAKYPLAEWKEAFTQLPSLSIVTEMANLFDAATEKRITP